MSSEKRRDPRFDIEQKLWCEGQNNMEARNMSRSGMMILTDQPREVGEEITISFDGADGTIEMKAEVMRKIDAKPGEQTGLGLRIVGFGQGEDAYDKFVKRQLQEQGIDDDEKKA